jgi:hypothetical protein
LIAQKLRITPNDVELCKKYAKYVEEALKTCSHHYRPFENQPVKKILFAVGEWTDYKLISADEVII